MSQKIEFFIASVAMNGLPHEVAVGRSVAEAERNLIAKLREDSEIVALVRAAEEMAEPGDETDYFDREVFFDLIRESEEFGYQWFQESIPVD